MATEVRKIVLLSDGTGNAAGKANRTNVWRLYQALDLERADQIAFYDDGVGTSGFKVFQLLGGAFGWGLSRNVRDLYEFLCRHHNPGDQIYIFGFSRGAFTARVVADLIGKCGVLDRSGEVHHDARGDKRVKLNTDLGLRIGVKLAFASYRRHYKAPLANLWRLIRDKLARPIPLPDEFCRQHSREVPIQFVGVFETVDAVGLPVDELSTMIDKLIYPHRFPDQDLSTKVQHAAHAIAIDDERHTFHPVLWNEKPVNSDGEGSRDDSQRITQVWFTGMHSNVGGGYPDDHLAYVPLQWMIRQVEQAGGLYLAPDKQTEIENRANPLGKLYDSRRGFAQYYRFNPRNIAKLCHAPTVTIDEPKIHRSVFERIAKTTVGYAPRGLPETYRLVNDGGAVPDQDKYEKSQAQQKHRAKLLERAQHHIFWRRVLYFLMVFATLGLFLMPYYFPPIPGAEPEGGAQQLLTKVFGLVTPMLPEMVESWTDAWTQSPWLFGALATALVVLRRHSQYIIRNTQRLAEAAWWHLKQPEGFEPDVAEVGRFERLAEMLEGNETLKTLHRINVSHVIPWLLILVCLAVLVGGLVRVFVYGPAVGGGVCGQWLDAQNEAPESGFVTSDPCFDTGVDLLAGQRYTIEVMPREWQDDGDKASIDGVDDWSHRFRPGFILGLPMRRSLLLPWFTLVGEVGLDSGESFPINRSPVTFRAIASGRLYLYVNDAIDPNRSSVWTFYENNEGSAEVTIERTR